MVYIEVLILFFVVLAFLGINNYNDIKNLIDRCKLKYYNSNYHKRKSFINSHNMKECMELQFNNDIKYFKNNGIGQKGWKFQFKPVSSLDYDIKKSNVAEDNEKAYIAGIFASVFNSGGYSKNALIKTSDIQLENELKKYIIIRYLSMMKKYIQSKKINNIFQASDFIKISPEIWIQSFNFKYSKYLWSWKQRILVLLAGQ